VTAGPSRVRAELVCLTGMHRSGTSLLARVVNLLGLGLGDEAALMGPGPDNPVGYWENRAVKELDDEVLAALGGSWDQPPLLSPGWETDAVLDPYRERALEILGRDYADGSAPLGCKEPRMSLLHPFWRTVVPITSTVVAVRHPVEVVGSLARRNGMDPGQGAALWLRYLFAATTVPALVVRLDDLTDRPEPTAARLAEHLGLPAPTAEVLDRIRAHHDPALLHRSAGAGPEAADPEIAGPENAAVALALAVWNDGAVDLDAVAEPVRAAIAQGWLGPPANRAALDAARAENVDLRERLRKWHRRRKALETQDPTAPLPPLPEVDGDDDREVDEP
jgi:hypothetical protein